MKWEDPIIAEVHEIRRQLMAEFGNDFHKLCEHLHAVEKEHPERYVTAEKLKSDRLAVAEPPAGYPAKR